MFRIVHNAETGEITQVELTQEEIADFNNRATEAAKKIAEEEKEIAQIKARREEALVKLEAFGFTADDLKALGL